jgi:hypothetical protein
MRRPIAKHTVRHFMNNSFNIDSGQCLSRSHLYTQHQRGVPELHLVLLVPSSGVDQSGEATVRAAMAVPFSQWLSYSGIKNNIRKRL